MTAAQLDEAICHQYDNGRYSPTGADGGALRYVLVNIDGKRYHAEITLDPEIAAIRRIWALADWTTDKHVKIYDHLNTYYSLRRAA